MIACDAERDCLLTVIKGEFKEMPGLQLTKAQAQRLWGLEAEICEALLGELEESHFLRVTELGRYRLAESDLDVLTLGTFTPWTLSGS